MKNTKYVIDNQNGYCKRERNTLLYSLLFVFRSMFCALRSSLFAFSILFIAICSTLSAFSEAYAVLQPHGFKIAIFPFENFSEDKEAITITIPALREKLGSMGYEILDDESMNKFMIKERIRTTGCVCHDIAIKIGKELNVQAVLTGTINTYIKGDNLEYGLTLRLISTTDGSIIWAEHSAGTGEDFTGILEIGKIKSIERLTEKILNKALKSFSISLPKKESESVYKIAVMPFQNMSRIKDSGNIVTYIFLTELFKNKKFFPVEYGEVRRLIVDLRVREKGELDMNHVAEIARKAGIDAILVGSVDTYRSGSGTDIAPEAEISARLIDARKNKVIWCNTFHVKGDDDIFMLDWGRIRSVENTAYKAVKKLVKDMEKAKWQ